MSFYIKIMLDWAIIVVFFGYGLEKNGWAETFPSPNRDGGLGCPCLAEYKCMGKIGEGNAIYMRQLVDIAPDLTCVCKPDSSMAWLKYQDCTGWCAHNDIIQGYSFEAKQLCIEYPPNGCRCEMLSAEKQFNFFLWIFMIVIFFIFHAGRNRRRDIPPEN